jgi:hypothetical protein
MSSQLIPAEPEAADSMAEAIFGGIFGGWGGGRKGRSPYRAHRPTPAKGVLRIDAQAVQTSESADMRPLRGIASIHTQDSDQRSAPRHCQSCETTAE